MPDHPQRRHFTRREIAEMRAILVECWPLAFMPKSAPKKPLKVGIRNDIYERMPDFDGRLIAAIGDYTSGRTYLDHIVEGTVRVRLDGSVAGIVTVGQAEHAVTRRQENDRRIDAVRRHKIEGARAQEQAAEAIDISDETVVWEAA